MLHNPKAFESFARLDFNRLRMEDEWRRVLYGAIAFLDRVGWIQHDDGDVRWGICASMAMRCAAYDPALGLETPGKSWIKAAQKFCTWAHVTDVPAYNDAYGRTKEEVQAALRACAEQ